MKKDIKDYLPFYLGRDVVVQKKQGNESLVKGRFCEITSGSNHGDWIMVQFDTVVEFMYYNFNERSSNFHTFFIGEDHIKLILRPLSDITEEERKELWRMVFSQGNRLSERARDFTGRTEWIGKRDTYSEPRWVLMQGVERLGIEMNGHVWADCDLYIWKHNQHETTRWLLSKGFDLFGLIEAGLAIDKSTLKEKA